MTKKIIALILTLIFIFIPTTFAANERREFVDGRTHSLDLSKAVSLTGATIGKDSISLNAGGSVAYQLTMPFYAKSVTISATAGKSVEFNVNGVSETVTLPKEEERTTHTFHTAIRREEIDIVITAKEAITIKSITFNEITEERAAKGIALETTDYEKATSNAFIIREGSPIIKDKTAIRYLDYNDVSRTPVYINGSLYIPADALAQALGCYYEEDKEKDFMVVRKEDTELVYINGRYKVIIDGDSTELNWTKEEVNGKRYLPVRATAEMFDYYILYKEGFVIGDYRSRAQNIADNFFSELTTEFSEYISTGYIGKTYYVAKSQNASDYNDGSINSPFATIAKASEMAKAGDTVIVRGGEYNEIIKPKNDGTAANPITYKAMEGEEVTITAFETINQFVDFKDGLAIAYIPWDLGLGRNQVFYKDKNIIEARYPNDTVGDDGLVEYMTGIRLDPLWVTVGDIHGIPGKEQDVVYSDTLLQEEDGTWDGAVYVTQRGAAWTLCSAIVDRHTKGQLKLKDMSKYWWFASNQGYPDYGYLTCHVNAIDLPLEWTIKNNYLYIKLPEGETASTMEVKVKKRQLVFDLDNRQYIHINGFRTFGGGAKMNNSKMCVINNCDMNYISHYTYFQDNRNAFIDDGNVRDENGAPPRGEVGIYMAGSDNAFVNSKIHFSAGTGLFIVGSYCYVANNIMEDLCYGGTSCGGVHFDAEAFKTPTTRRGGHTVIYNTISKIARNAVSLNRPEENAWIAAGFLPCEIAYNDVSDSSICTLDTGMIYLWGSNMEDGFRYSSVHNNYIYSTATKAPFILGAVYWDNWMMGTDTYDNLIWATMEGQFKNDVYEQHKKGFKTSYSTVDSWNNINLGVKKDGKTNLTLTDFRSVKPFKAGSSIAGYDDYNFTYEYYLNGDEGIYLAKDAILSDGVVIKDNVAQFTNENQYIKFENVDFSKGNWFNLVYTGDYYNDYNKCHIVIGDTLEAPIHEFDLQLNAESKNPDDLDTAGTSLLPYTMMELTGKSNVWIKPVTYGNSGIYQIHLTDKFINNQDIDYDYTRIVAGTFSLCQKGIRENDQPPTPQMRTAVDPDYPILTATWKGGWTKYGNVNVKEPCTKFTAVLGSSEAYLGNIIQLRLESPDGEIIGSLENVANGWGWTEVTVDLKRRLDPGTYDLYLTFDGKDMGCSDIHWFGLK